MVNYLPKKASQEILKAGDDMPYVSPELILEAKQMDLLTYLQNYEPNNLVRVSGNTFSTREHDSLKISNGKWMWFSRGFGGVTALDYLIKVKGFSFIKAVETITGKGAITIPKPIIKEKKQQPLLLPDRCKNNYLAVKYLFDRGIDIEIINYCIDNNLLYESCYKGYHNIIFIGYDDKKKPMYAAYRSLSGRRFLGDCSGSNKRYSFQLSNSESDEIHLFECAIDLLSYATIAKMEGRNWKELSLVSLSGVYSPKSKIEESKMPVVLEKYFEQHPNTKKVYLHLDNDYAGRLATTTLQTIIPKCYEVIDEPPYKGKDINDYLCLRLGIARKIDKKAR